MHRLRLFRDVVCKKRPLKYKKHSYFILYYYNIIIQDQFISI